MEATKRKSEKGSNSNLGTVWEEEMDEHPVLLDILGMVPSLPPSLSLHPPSSNPRWES